MAKDSFIIYKSFYPPISSLSDKQLGKLFRSLFDFQINGNELVEDDIKMAFSFFKNQMELDEKKYQTVIERNKHNGANGGRPRNTGKETQANPENPVGFQKPKKPYNDNVNDNDNENEELTPPTNSGNNLPTIRAWYTKFITTQSQAKDLLAMKSSMSVREVDILAISFIMGYVESGEDLDTIKTDVGNHFRLWFNKNQSNGTLHRFIADVPKKKIEAEFQKNKIHEYAAS